MLYEKDAQLEYVVVGLVEAVDEQSDQRFVPVFVRAHDLVEPRAEATDGIGHDHEQAMLFRFEVVIEGGRPDVDRSRYIRPFRVLVSVAAEVLGRDVEDLFPLYAGLAPRRVPLGIRDARGVCAVSVIRLTLVYLTERTRGFVNGARPPRFECGFR